jgi:hypothetical protein
MRAVDPVQRAAKLLWLVACVSLLGTGIACVVPRDGRGWHALLALAVPMAIGAVAVGVKRRRLVAARAGLALFAALAIADVAGVIGPVLGRPIGARLLDAVLFAAFIAWPLWSLRGAERALRGVIG